MAELGHDEEDKLLRDEINHSPGTKPATSEKANTLEATLLKLNDNMLSVIRSISTMQKTLAWFADGHRPLKSQELMNCLTQTPNSNNAASEILEDDSDTLLEEEKNCLTQAR